MKLMHLSDLHLGKTLCGYSLLDDQRYILDRILEITQAQKPDAVLIAGDVFDRSAPSAETVALMADFLTRLSALGSPILMIAGNHDSPERIAYGSRIMERSSIFMSPVYDGTIKSVTLTDAHGKVTMELDPSVRHVLLAHQFVTGASLSGSEEVYCGTAEQVSAEVFAPFMYTAMGHLHNPMNVGSPRVRYCGTPLKYSASEVGSTKSVTIAKLGEIGTEPVITEIPLVPLRDMKKLHGSFEELICGTDDNFVQVLLTDETDVPDAMAKLRMHYPYILGMDYDRKRPDDMAELELLQQEPDKDPEELFAAFFEQVQGMAMRPQQAQIIHDLVEALWKKEANV